MREWDWSKVLQAQLLELSGKIYDTRLHPLITHALQNLQQVEELRQQFLG